MENSGMNIYISGSMAYDRIMDFPGKFSDYILPDKIHILNVCFNVNGMEEKFGGTAGNIAYTLRLLQERPIIMATIGKDYISYFEWLKKNDITIEGIKIIKEEFTASAYITTDRADNQITGFNPGAMRHQADYRLDGADPEKSIVLIAPGNLQDMIRYADNCREKGIKYICDPGQSLSLWTGEMLKDWLKDSFMLISNDYELELIIKMTGLNKKELLGLTNTIITTLGENGSIVITDNLEITIQPVRNVNVVDPTGAGDAYRAGFLKGLASKKDILTAAKMGSVAASYAIENYGTQEHFFTYKQFTDRYEQNYGYS